MLINLAFFIGGALAGTTIALVLLTFAYGIEEQHAPVSDAEYL